MATFPLGLYTHTTLYDNTDDVLAAHPNALGAEIVEIEKKIGVNSSAVSDSQDYKLRNLPAQASTGLITNLNADKLDDADLDTDGTLAGNSDTSIPSEKAVKTYTDTKLPSSYLDTDGTMAANSDVKVASQKATKTYADTKIPKTDIDTNTSLGTSDTKVPSQKAVKTYVDTETKAFGSWVDKSSSYGAQQATTDGFVLAYTAIGCENKYLSGFTDASSNPTTRVAYFDLRGAYSGGRGNMNIMFPVKKNDYWKVTTDATISKVYWIPLS